MAMKTPEKQILPIAPSYPDLNSLTKWAGDLTRTLQQNLATIARKANDDTALSPTADINMNGFSITNINNLGNISGTITYKGADIDTRYVNVTGDTMTGKLTFVAGATGAASWNMPAASGAPSSPVNGDMWNDNVHYRARLGGVTYSLAMLEKAETLTAAWTFATAASGQESLIVPHGTAPSAPTNGSIWSTTAAFFGRINGTTKTFAMLETAQTFNQATTFSALVTGNGGFSGVIGATGSAAGTFTSVTNTGLTDISGASAGQIKFPTTQNASANVNTLDDYKEGTWTPAITFGGGNTGITYGTQTGNYTKIGRIVHLQGRVTLTNKGSSTGAAAITGLPFTVATTYFPGSIGYFANFTGLTGIPLVYAESSTATATLVQTGVATVANLTNTAFTNTTDFIFNITYFV